MPANKQIVDYINNGLNEGHDINSLRNALISVGWQLKDIDDSIQHVTGTGQTKTSKSQEIGLLSRFKMIFTSPMSFFDNIKSEEGYRNVFKYFFLLTLIPALSASLMSLSNTSSDAISLDIVSSFLNPESISSSVPFFSIPILFSLEYIFAFVNLCVSAVIVHFFVRVFRGSGRLNQTFKAIVYGTLTPTVASSIVVILIAISAIVTPLESMMFLLIISAIISSIFSLWGLALLIIGISRLHDVTIIKAIIISFMIPLVLILIIISSVIFALGVISPATFSASSSTWSTEKAMGFYNIGTPEPGSWKLSQAPADDQFQLVITNEFPSRIRINDIIVSVDGETCTTTSGTGFVNFDSVITIEANCGNQVAGSSYDTDIEIEYENMDTGLGGFHETGTVSGIVI